MTSSALETSAAAAADVGCSLSVDELGGMLLVTAVVEERVLSLVDSLRTLHNRVEELRTHFTRILQLCQMIGPSTVDHIAHNNSLTASLKLVRHVASNTKSQACRED
jgi:hypothetical protein